MSNLNDAISTILNIKNVRQTAIDKLVSEMNEIDARTNAEINELHKQYNTKIKAKEAEKAELVGPLRDQIKALNLEIANLTKAANVLGVNVVIPEKETSKKKEFTMVSETIHDFIIEKCLRVDSGLTRPEIQDMLYNAGLIDKNKNAVTMASSTLAYMNQQKMLFKVGDKYVVANKAEAKRRGDFRRAVYAIITNQFRESGSGKPKMFTIAELMKKLEPVFGKQDLYVRTKGVLGWLIKTNNVSYDTETDKFLLIKA